MNNCENSIVQEMKMPECPICYEVISDQVDVHSDLCKHAFHYSCLIKTLFHGSNHCPMCRSQVKFIQVANSNPLISRLYLTKTESFVNIMQIHIKNNTTLEGYSFLCVIHDVAFPIILDVIVRHSNLHNLFLINNESQYEELNPLLNEYMDVPISYLEIPNAGKGILIQELKTKLFLHDGKFVSFSRVYFKGAVNIDELFETYELEKLAKYFQ